MQIPNAGRSGRAAWLALLLGAACHEEPVFVVEFQSVDAARAPESAPTTNAPRQPAAARDAGPPTAPSTGPPRDAGTPLAAPPSPLDACRSDEDCVAEPAECCPCSAGGKAVARTRRRAAQDRKARAARCGETTMCPEVLSNDPSCLAHPACREGRCVLVPLR